MCHSVKNVLSLKLAQLSETVEKCGINMRFAYVKRNGGWNRKEHVREDYCLCLLLIFYLIFDPVTNPPPNNTVPPYQNMWCLVWDLLQL